MEKVLSISNFKIIKKVSKNLMQVVLLLVIFDLILGLAVDHVFSHYDSASGIFRIAKTLRKNSESKIIFIGNSRIVNTIDPSAAEPSKIINLGFYETGLKFWYVYLNAVSNLNLNNQYVLEIPDGEFIGEPYPDKNIKNYLLPNLRSKNLFTTELEFHFIEKVFSKTNMFVYASIIPNLLEAMILNKKFNGFIDVGNKPICEVGFKCKVSPHEDKNFNPKLTIKNHTYLNKLIKLVKEKNLNVTFIIAPIHSNGVLLAKYKEQSLFEVENYLKSNGLKIFNYSDDETYRNKDELFHDLYHLNNVGAKIFTKAVLSDLEVN